MFLKDMRSLDFVGDGISINLAMSVRAIEALKEVGCEANVLQRSIPMRGRMIHELDGSTWSYPYGTKHEVLADVIILWFRFFSGVRIVLSRSNVVKIIVCIFCFAMFVGNFSFKWFNIYKQCTMNNLNSRLACKIVRVRDFEGIRTQMNWQKKTSVCAWHVQFSPQLTITYFVVY